eukprot:312977_1
MNDGKRLHSGWRATADIGLNPTPDSVTLLGIFQTITEFWRFFNNLGRDQPLDMLPNVVNFRMFRMSILSKHAVNSKSYASGSWEISLSSKGSSHNEKFIKLCLLVCCELLGTDVNGVILNRSMNDICISIWCETEGNISISDNLYKYFSSDDLLSLNYISHGKNLISARKNDNHNIKSIIEYNLNDAYSISQDSSSKLIPNDLHSVAWNELQRESLQYQQFNNNNNNN